MPVCESENAGGNNNGGDTLDGNAAKASGKLGEVSISEKNSHAAEPARVDILQLRNSDDRPPERVEGVQVNKENEVCLGKSDCGEGHDRSSDPQPSALSDFTQENMSSKEGSHVSSVQGTASSVQGTASTETRGSPSPTSANVEEITIASAEDDFPNDKKLADPPIDLPEKLSERDVSFATCTVKSGPVCSDVPRGAFINSDNSGVISTAIGDVRAHASVVNGREDNVRMMNFSSTNILLTAGENDTLATSSSPALSDIVHESGQSGDQKSDFTRMESILAVKNNERSRKRSSRKKHRTASCFSKSAVGISPNVCDKRSEMEFDCGLVDALEVARQVAQDVEREVGDYRESSCSSSFDTSSPCRSSQRDSPESVRVSSQHGAEFSSEIEVGEGHSTQPSSGDRCLIDTKPDLVTNSDTPVKDQESPVSVAAQEPDVNPEIGACDFDLNREVCSDDINHPVNPIHPSIANISASAPAAATGTSTDPSQNDGGTSSFLKRAQSSLVFDLNVAEGDDKIADQVLGNKLPGPSDPHTGVYSVEMSPGKSKRLNLDLNQVSDDGDPAPPNLRMEGFYHQTALRSPTPVSSSLSLQRRTLRNIDLNDKPAFQNDFSDQGSYSGSLGQGSFGRCRSGDSVISIMGAKVEIPRSDLTSQSLSFSNGKALEPQQDTNVTRTEGFLSMGPAGAYAHSPVFGYNGMVAGPTMSFSSPVLGSRLLPYLMDTRGSPVVPQFLGPGPVVHHSQQPFIINMNCAPPGLTGPGLCQQSFDLNSAFVMEDSNKDAGGLRQFMPGQTKLLEEQLQPCSISGVGVKRKEPDNSWGTYPFNYKYQQQPWK